ncbi:MAG: heavy-metal-associated domain-containing protein [Nitrospirae bacterium]|nr:heavy-metal-associated domain-containing protein [Nitrospirota bacterium]
MAASDAAKSLAGVTFVDDDMMNASLTIVFDDTKTDMEKIREAMKKAGFPVEGEPEILKQ